MTEDIVARLRDCTCVPHGEICREAADEIERLRCGLKHICDAEYSEPYSADFAADVLAGRCEFEDHERTIVSESGLRMEAENEKAKALYWIKEYEEMKARWVATFANNRQQLEQISDLRQRGAAANEQV